MLVYGDTMTSFDDDAAIGPVRVAALYCFAQFDDPVAAQTRLLRICNDLEVRGTLLLAREGINGTIAGRDDAIAQVVAHIRALPGCAATDVKYATAPAMPFGKMKVRVKREIVTMGVENIDPRTQAGIYVEPRDWNALIADPDTILVDTRNDYEVAIGNFDRAIDPHTHSFREFPGWLERLADDLRAQGRAPKIAMYCTGGIRCEKSTAFARRLGLDQVYHLRGGILRYLEEIPAEESRWTGACFVFDERVSVGHGLTPGGHVMCRACGHPYDPAHPHGCVLPE